MTAEQHDAIPRIKSQQERPLNPKGLAPQYRGRSQRDHGYQKKVYISSQYIRRYGYGHDN